MSVSCFTVSVHGELASWENRHGGRVWVEDSCSLLGAQEAEKGVGGREMNVPVPAL